jgi:hypothetical protein
MVYDRPEVIGGWAREGLRLSCLTGEDADRWGGVGERSGFAGDATHSLNSAMIDRILSAAMLLSSDLA